MFFSVGVHMRQVVEGAGLGPEAASAEELSAACACVSGLLNSVAFVETTGADGLPCLAPSSAAASLVVDKSLTHSLGPLREAFARAVARLAQQQDSGSSDAEESVFTLGDALVPLARAIAAPADCCADFVVQNARSDPRLQRLLESALAVAESPRSAGLLLRLEKKDEGEALACLECASELASAAVDCFDSLLTAARNARAGVSLASEEEGAAASQQRLASVDALTPVFLHLTQEALFQMRGLPVPPSARSAFDRCEKTGVPREPGYLPALAVWLATASCQREASSLRRLRHEWAYLLDEALALLPAQVFQMVNAEKGEGPLCSSRGQPTRRRRSRAVGRLASKFWLCRWWRRCCLFGCFAGTDVYLPGEPPARTRAAARFSFAGGGRTAS